MRDTGAFPTDPDEAGPALLSALDRLVAEGGRLILDPATVEQDLAGVVLGQMEFLRRLLEAQVVRRFEDGSLTAEQEEAFGQSLMRTAEALRILAARFGLTERDLWLEAGDLGSLG